MSVVKSIRWIVGIFCCCIAIFSFSWKGWLKISTEKYLHPKFHLKKIEQTSSAKEILKTSFFAETLQLSEEMNRSIYTLPLHDMEKILLSYPFIKQAKLAIKKPDTLQIIYEVRLPFAILQDYHNAWIDEEGVIFPIYPFFTPKKLFSLFLGAKMLTEEDTKKRFFYAKEVVFLVKKTTFDPMTFCYLDVSKAFQPSLGEREVVMVFIAESAKHYLRLNPKKISSALVKYQAMLKKNPDLSQKNLSIDFRLEDLGFLEPF